MTLVQCAVREIHDFHSFLVAWSKGSAPDDPNLLARRLAGFDPSFFAISRRAAEYAASRISRPWLRTSHGRQPSLRIEIASVEARRADGVSALLTYEESQTSDENGSTRRLATSVFLPKADAPNGAVWFHLHEVWLP